MFTRSEDWAPDWVHRAILFGNNGIGGTIGSEWAWLDDQLIEWCMGDGADYTVLNYDVFELWQREQAKWDAVGDDPTSPLN